MHLEVYCKSRGGGEDGKDVENDRRDDELERAMRMDGSILGIPDAFVRQVSSRAYDLWRVLIAVATMSWKQRDFKICLCIDSPRKPSWYFENSEKSQVFEDENEAAKYCDLLKGGGQNCEGVAEIEASSVFDLCQKNKALAVLFRRGRTPSVPKNLKLNLRARKRSLEDQEDLA